MTDSEIDEAILSVVQDGWLKIARIVGDVGKRLNLDGYHDKDQIESIVEKIRVLVGDGRLVAQGDLSQPRYSEVRLPDADE